MNFDEEAMKIRRGKHGVIETIPGKSSRPTTT